LETWKLSGLKNVEILFSGETLACVKN